MAVRSPDQPFPSSASPASNGEALRTERVDGGVIPRFVLEAFSARSSGSAAVLDDTDLWTEEAAHRANNLAQLAASLASFQRRRGAYDLDKVERITRDLSSLYAELGATPHDGGARPCAEPLRRLVTDLVALFGPTAGTIAANVRADPFSLHPLRRRALLLLASELTINALRHAFPCGDGLLDVSLTCDGVNRLLRVCDDGVGFGDGSTSGTGSQLVTRLAAILGGRLQTISQPQAGTQVLLWFSASHPATGGDQ